LDVVTPAGVETIPENWLLGQSQDFLRQWVLKTSTVLDGDERNPSADDYRRNYYMRRSAKDGIEPSMWVCGAPEYSENGVRLVADRGGISILCLKGFALQAVRTPGFIGVINCDNVIPDASRTKAVDSDIFPIIERAQAAVAAGVTSGLDAIGEQGFSTTKIELFSWCSGVYGMNTVIASTFRFLQIVEKNGSSYFVSYGKFVDMLKSAKAVFIGLNTGPISLLKRWHDFESADTNAPFSLCFSGVDGLSVYYLSNSEVKTGAFADLLSSYESSAVFSLALRAFQEAWGVSELDLVRQDGWVHKGSDMHGYMTRP
jgi:hypothetical protein